MMTTPHSPETGPETSVPPQGSDTAMPSDDSPIDLRLAGLHQKNAQLHREMADVNEALTHAYVDKSKFMGKTAAAGAGVDTDASGTDTDKGEAKEDPEVIAHQEYEKLKNSWGRLGIEIPEEDKLRERLVRAQDVKAALETDWRLEGSMGVVLVPPTDVVGWPVPDELRARQTTIENSTRGVDLILGRRKNYGKGGSKEDHIVTHEHHGKKKKHHGSDDHDHAHIEAPEPSDQWRVIVTQITPEGTYVGNRSVTKKPGSPNSIIQAGGHIIAGYDTRGMGLTEYTALTLQSEKPIDYPWRTWLMKGFEGGNLKNNVVLAGFDPTVKKPRLLKPASQRYTFESINPNYSEGMARFRPTVEIFDAEPEVEEPQAPEEDPAAPEPQTDAPAKDEVKPQNIVQEAGDVQHTDDDNIVDAEIVDDEEEVSPKQTIWHPPLAIPMPPVKNEAKTSDDESDEESDS